MINCDMRAYTYFTLGEDNGYGMPTLSTSPTGTIKMAIYTTSQSIQDNINYSNASYIGMTSATNVDSTYVIDYEGKRLKVLYVQPRGRFKQVFMERM
jgi:hypothetical protein